MEYGLGYTTRRSPYTPYSIYLRGNVGGLQLWQWHVDLGPDYRSCLLPSSSIEEASVPTRIRMPGQRSTCRKEASAEVAVWDLSEGSAPYK